MEPLSEAQIAHFGEHSFVVVPGVLSEHEVAATRAAVARNLPPSALEGGGGEGASYSLDHGGAASAMLDPALAAIAVHPVVLGSVAQLLGCEELVLSAFVAYMKHEGAGGTSADYEGALPGKEGAHMDYKTYQQVPTRPRRSVRSAAELVVGAAGGVEPQLAVRVVPAVRPRRGARPALPRPRLPRPLSDPAPAPRHFKRRPRQPRQPVLTTTCTRPSSLDSA